jgi:hypothetical protein
VCLYGSQNTQRLFPYTALTDWFHKVDGVCLLRGTTQSLHTVPVKRIIEVRTVV